MRWNKLESSANHRVGVVVPFHVLVPIPLVLEFLLTVRTNQVLRIEEQTRLVRSTLVLTHASSSCERLRAVSASEGQRYILMAITYVLQ